MGSGRTYVHPGPGSDEGSYRLPESNVEDGRAYSRGRSVPIDLEMSRALVRPDRPSRLVAAFVGVLAIVALITSATGFGATSATELPSATVVGTLALTDPVAKSADPPVCTDAVAPLDTDDCTDVTFTGGASKILRLGSLSGSDVQAGSLRWTVTTTNVTGYRVHMSNVGAAPLLRSASSTIPDMPTSPLLPASSVDDATHFGVAMGDPAADNEGAVSYTGSPWVTGGQQGELFSGIPTTDIVIAERTSAQTADPFTATFAAASVASAQPAAGSYAGTVRIVASAL